MAPNGGLDFEAGLLEPLRRFEAGLQDWCSKEQASVEDRSRAALADQLAVEAGEKKLKECLKTSYPDHSLDGTSALQALVGIGRDQRTQLHQMLELVRSHLSHFDNTEALAEQLPAAGGAARKVPSEDVVGLLAEQLDVASRSLAKARAEPKEPKKKKEEEPKRKEEEPAREREGREGRRREDDDSDDGGRERGGGAVEVTVEAIETAAVGLAEVAAVVVMLAVKTVMVVNVTAAGGDSLLVAEAKGTMVEMSDGATARGVMVVAMEVAMRAAARAMEAVIGIATTGSCSSLLNLQLVM
eukprot:CAMPEP_0169118028 /NCGR_PEP_ID=MMETSP1015-20121227/30778_1 /TAXON_ID=342587 /ORGANISM="Karlodinium micrum, Strain CCMP2283" /LENGTH=298 /DNA_ID=CAMNT_0009180761 /DNA_START=57 /DNA_END=954 /DNA_ORIENTATION=+